MIILTAAVAIYALFKDVFTANDTLNSVALFTMYLISIGAVMYRFKDVLL